MTRRAWLKPGQTLRGVMAGVVCDRLQRSTTSLAYHRETLRTDAELLEYVDDHIGLRIPRRRCCHGHVPPAVAFCNAYFAREPFAIWWASRGYGGKSVQLAALGMAEAVTMGAGVVVLGGSAEQSQRVLAYMGGTDTNLPNAFWNSPGAPVGLIKGEVARRTSLKNGGWIHALAASTRSVRGPHPQRLRLDEVDEMEWKIYTAATGQPMGKPDAVTGALIESQTVASSTWHYPDKTMSKLLQMAPERGWPVYEWCYRESMRG